MAVDSGGRHAVTAAEGFEELAARVWDLHTGRCVHVLGGHRGPVTSVCVIPDGLVALTGSGDRTVRVWDVSTGRCLRVHVCMTPDGRHILSSGHAENAVWMWELSSGRRVARFLGHTSTVWSVCVDPTGWFAVTGGKDGTARLWDLPSGELARTLTGHSGSVRSVCTTPDGRFAITGGEDATARVWDLPSGDPRFILEGHTSSVISVRTTPDGRFALTAGQDDGSVRQWDLTTGPLRAHSGDVRLGQAGIDLRHPPGAPVDGLLAADRCTHTRPVHPPLHPHS
jgi:WD40 repeat protein